MLLPFLCPSRVPSIKIHQDYAIHSGHFSYSPQPKASLHHQKICAHWSYFLESDSLPRLLSDVKDSFYIISWCVQMVWLLASALLFYPVSLYAAVSPSRLGFNFQPQALVPATVCSFVLVAQATGKTHLGCCC